MLLKYTYGYDALMHVDEAKASYDRSSWSVVGRDPTANRREVYVCVYFKISMAFLLFNVIPYKCC